ncbi:5-formyltetrahydrofolate cyclo-ligase [Carboxydothermus hydrogenoformans]|uniref:5-formyltetrahydrofolate cyclo-ligase n=1 Tax=Carboxydothermus hydrogenoformans (strain ATCC BAA-161 / DSM 6008 / Z-2901) TaxID=246194 RepID=Q3AE50_CARHZ|nr:5-formyltetrahydrofolate cyclo-ligase [Carboxydothermus hydrogenoformans]ABB13654.1 5-formyltetrahydrofolate cyclo-ligase family protein [Carboxydothermus hydrogenoformans Z-2901]
MDDKKVLRKEILNKRAAQTPAEIAAKSSRILTLLKAFAPYQQARTVMVYLDFRGEVKTREIIRDLWAYGKKVVIPVTVLSEKKLLPVYLRDFGDLVEGTYGILEPKEEARTIAEPEVIDLVLVPGVAFDLKGNRLGYGAGFYDRFLPNLQPAVKKVALAFELQIVPKIPTGPHDIPMDYIITEERIINCRLY